ncbi:MAG: hypothetical protein SF069_13785 [Phycisphaerae bacterium]|nr:hypothetical protein [Phycisphaerae bacterium]
MIVTKRKVHIGFTPRRRRAINAQPRPADTVEPGTLPRVSRLMALAIHFDRLFREGRVADLSELARLTHVSQPRITQIMSLNLLAPDIQEALLHLPLVTRGRQPIHEKRLRKVVLTLDWREQRARWSRILAATAMSNTSADANTNTSPDAPTP